MTGVCWLITSQMRICQGGVLCSRHGRSRPCSSNQAVNSVNIVLSVPQGRANPSLWGLSA